MTDVSRYLEQPLNLGYRDAIERYIAELEDELSTADSDPRRRDLRATLRLLRLELRHAP
jgi:hypothetical protein